jgi:hypothetical protein
MVLRVIKWLPVRYLYTFIYYLPVNPFSNKRKTVAKTFAIELFCSVEVPFVFN